MYLNNCGRECVQKTDKTCKKRPLKELKIQICTKDIQNMYKRHTQYSAKFIIIIKMYKNLITISYIFRLILMTNIFFILTILRIILIKIFH